MISSRLVCSSFISSTCYAQQQGEIVRRRLKPSLRQIGGEIVRRRLRPSLRQIGGLNLHYQESKNLTYDISKRCSSRIYASLLPNLESDGVSIVDAFVQESDVSWTKKWDAFYKFTRPFILYGLIVGIISMSLLPVETTADLSPTYFMAFLKIIIPRVLMNIYISSVNQIFDIEIDKINKPYLALASGEISISAAWAITSLSAILSIIMVMMLNSPPLLYTFLGLFFVGTTYSVDLPFLRWKGNTFLAALYFIFDMAILHPLGLFVHFQKYILGKPLVFTKPILFTVVFMTIMSIIISIVKDLPDVKGDKAFGLRSPSIIFGEEKVFWSCVYTLMATYGGATIFGATSAFLPNKIFTILAHGILAATLWNKAKSINTSEPSSTYSFYLFLWKLVYVEYLIFPFVR